MYQKSKSMNTLDRLSELPDSLIFSIFELLPMRDVVATTILSKRWRNLWTTAPCLNFVDFHSGDANFITRTLLFWRGTKILKLKIEMYYVMKENLFSEVDLWVRFAKDHEVQELYLRPVGLGDVQYPVPQYLFSSCPSLRVLSLEGCKLHIDRNVQWNQLKSLTIHSEDGLGHDDINRVLSGSPLLEVLDLKFLETNEHLTIRSTSLKKLSIDKYTDGYDNPAPQMNTRLIICTPNLETFEISNIPYFRCSLDNVSSLADVSLLFNDFYDSWNGFPEQTLKQILPAIQHVENVTLSYWCLEALGTLKKEHLAPRLWDVKFLKFSAYIFDHELIAGVLEIFPKVEMLVLEDADDEMSEETESFFNFQPSLPNLKRVDVTWDGYTYSIFPLIEILFKYASSLEKMVFRVRREPTSNSLLQASQKLLKMEKSSPTAKFIFCEC